MARKFLSYAGLQKFLNNLFGEFAQIIHYHQVSDIIGLDEALGGSHFFVIDFQEAREVVQMHTFDAMKIGNIKTANVSTLRLSINGTVQTITLTNGEWTGSSASRISIPANALLVWQVGRTTGGSVAEISVQYE